MFFRRQRSEGIEGLDRIRESLRRQQREREERGEVDDLLVTDPTDLDEGVEIITPVREPPPETRPEVLPSEQPTETRPAVMEATPFVETALTEEAPVQAEPVTAPVPAPVEQPTEQFRPPEPVRVGSGESLIARNASWEGQLYAEGDVRIEGALQGSIEAHATLFIAQDARVKAKVRARNIIIAGEFDGEIVCEEKLEVLPTGSIAGQVNASTLVIHEGAFVDSRFAMHIEGNPGRSAH